jgi:hypothetical protein
MWIALIFCKGIGIREFQGKTRDTASQRRHARPAELTSDCSIPSKTSLVVIVAPVVTGERGLSTGACLAATDGEWTGRVMLPFAMAGQTFCHTLA